MRGARNRTRRTCALCTFFNAVPGVDRGEINNFITIVIIVVEFRVRVCLANGLLRRES